MFQIDFKRYKWAILFCSISAIGALVYGYDNSYYNGVIAMQYFKDHFGDRIVNGKKELATSFTSLTASSIYIGDLLGALLSAPINDRWGRKAVFVFGSLCILGGGVAQVAATHQEGLIIFGRILIGFGVGSFTVTSLLYMGEIAPLAIRGPALMMFQFLQSCSQLIASGITQGSETIKSTLSYKLPMGGLVVLPLIMFICLPFLPESPVWYVLKGHREDAAKSYKRIHKSEPEYDPTTDIEMLEEAKRVQEEERAKSSWSALFSDSIERKKIIFSAGAMFAQQINGILYFYVYGVVFAQAIGIKQPLTIQLITNVLQIVAVGAPVVTGNKVR